MRPVARAHSSRRRAFVTGALPPPARSASVTGPPCDCARLGQLFPRAQAQSAQTGTLAPRRHTVRASVVLTRAPIAQSAEALHLKWTQSGFESLWGHRARALSAKPLKARVGTHCLDSVSDKQGHHRDDGRREAAQQKRLGAIAEVAD